MKNKKKIIIFNYKTKFTKVKFFINLDVFILLLKFDLFIFYNVKLLKFNLVIYLIMIKKRFFSHQATNKIKKYK